MASTPPCSCRRWNLSACFRDVCLHDVGVRDVGFHGVTAVDPDITQCCPAGATRPSDAAIREVLGAVKRSRLSAGDDQPGDPVAEEVVASP